MQSALRKTVTVKDGGIIEFQSPELTVGSTAEVIVIVDTPSEEPRKRLSEFIGNGKGAFGSAAEADQFIRGERDAWHS